ncbi:MAG: sugar phosphate isomerase/epimerase family protein [Thermomicrobiales bacterium]
MMPIAFSTISCPSFTVRQIAEAARRYGYDGVELYALEGQRLTPDVLEARLDEVRRDLAGVPIVSINSWGQLSSPDPAERSTQERQIARTFELATELGSPLVKTFGGELPGGRDVDEVLDYMAESLRRLARRAEALGVILVVETHDGFCRGADLAALLARVDEPRIAALWDVHHPYRRGESVAETDRLIGHRVAHVHVKDAVRVEDGWCFVLLGEGELPVPEMLSCLAARGFSGSVSVDWELMWHPEIAGPEEALPHFAAALRALPVAA